MAGKTKGGPRRARDAYHHGDLRPALIEAARRIVEREGPGEVSLRAVAREAGVSQAAPYHHFDDKAALLAALAAEGFREFTAAMLFQAKGSTDPGERLSALGVGYVLFAAKNASLFRLMHGPAFESFLSSAEFREAADVSFATLREAIEECAPEASKGQIAHACAATWALVHGIAMLCVDGRLAFLLDLRNLAATTRKHMEFMDVQSALANWEQHTERA
jgi:AcrR family transcriptional regulator